MTPRIVRKLRRWHFEARTAYWHQGYRAGYDAGYEAGWARASLPPSEVVIDWARQYDPLYVVKLPLEQRREVMRRQAADIANHATIK